MRSRWLVAVVLSACAAAGADAAPRGAPGSPPAARTVTLTGARTIAESGFARGGPAAGTYAVTESDRGLGSRSLVYAVPEPVPTSGIQPLTETIRAVVSVDRHGPIILSETDTVAGIDRGAGQTYTVNDVRTVTSSGLWAHVGAVEHIVERGYGTNGVSFASIDLTRTTLDDGSFDETGSLSNGEMHRLHVGPDFSASSHDQTPGFGLRDVTTLWPAGEDTRATIAVSVATQGRTIGDTPVVHATFAVPVWFPKQTVPTILEHRVSARAPLDRACRYPPGTTASLLHDRRRRIDPTGTIVDVTRDLYYGEAFTPLCRVERVSTTSVDVTTGTVQGTRTDNTSVSAADAGLR